MSKSVRGFATDRGRLYYRLLEQLKGILAQVGIYEFAVVGVARKLTDYGPQAQLTHFANPNFYNGAETNLPAAITDAAQWNHGTIAVITDGIVSIGEAQRVVEGGNSDQACASGFDAVCLSQAITSYVGHGNGFWIVSIRMPYQGPYYVEEPGPNSRRGQVLRGSFPPHPLQIWIGSPSVATGRGLAQELLQYAKTQHLEAIALEAAPGAWTRWTVAPLKPTNIVELPGFADGDKWASIGDQENPPNLQVLQPTASRFLRRKLDPRFGVALPVTVVTSGSAGLTPLLLADETVTPELPDVDAIVKFPASEAGQTGTYAEFRLKYRNALAEQRYSRSVVLDASWHVRPATAKPRESWSSDTDDDPKSLAGTVNFSSFLGLLQEQLVRTSQDEVVREPLLRLDYVKDSGGGFGLHH
ncbi:MAG TPA: hypothetical protein VKV28_17350 [Candidatus Binataceae bacterium]|nr:hypothetical protein [Candidatus Binataceae bacterium]